MTSREIRIITGIAKKQALPHIHYQELINEAVVRVLESRAKGTPSDDGFLIATTKTAIFEYKTRAGILLTIPRGSLFAAKNKQLKFAVGCVDSLDANNLEISDKKTLSPEARYLIKEVFEKSCREKTFLEKDVNKKVIAHIMNGDPARFIVESLGVTCRAVLAARKAIERTLINFGYKKFYKDKRYGNKYST